MGHVGGADVWMVVWWEESGRVSCIRSRVWGLVK